MSTSVLVLLRREAKKKNRTVAELLQYLGMERFLYRLGCSPHKESLVLKGAMMMRVWSPDQFRPTRDIDFLAFGLSGIEHIKELVQQICRVPVPQDGFFFDPDSVRCEPIKEADDYHGVNARFTGTVEGAHIPMRVDFAFGDAVVPAPIWSEYPVILNFPAPYLRTYSSESVIAEKLHAMVKLETINSRMKDFFDIWFLSRHRSFLLQNLAASIKKTFQIRTTIIPCTILSLQEPYIHDHHAMWNAFCKKSALIEVPDSFALICKELSAFIAPVLNACQNVDELNLRWDFSGMKWK